MPVRGFGALADIAAFNTSARELDSDRDPSKREGLPIELWRALPDAVPRILDSRDKVLVAKALDSFVTVDGVRVPKGALVERTSEIYLQDPARWD